MRTLAPHLARLNIDKQQIAEVMDFLAITDQFFLNLAMAYCKSAMDAGAQIRAGSIVTAMTRNGDMFGIRVSGLGDRWFTAPVNTPQGLFFTGFAQEQANPDMGDSAITETFGIGGAAMIAAPGVTRFVGAGGMEAAMLWLMRMARSKAYLFAGVEIRWKCAPELIGDDTPPEAVFQFPGGLADHLKEQLGDRECATTQFFSGNQDFPGEAGRVEWAVAWPLWSDGSYSWYCNTIPTPDGGTHEAGLRTAIVKGIRAFGALVGQKKAEGIAADDVVAGSEIMLSVFIRDPQFQSQTKDRLTSPEAARLVVFTSGSTGEPVAIEKRLRQLDAEVHALEAALGPGLEGATVHGTVSHQHIYGLLFRVLWPLSAGRAIVPRAFFPEDLLAAMDGQDAVLVASPAHLKRLPAQLDWASLHGRLRAVFSSGGVLPAEAAHEVSRLLGVSPTEILGSSETGGIAWRRWREEQPGWRALPGVEWRVQEGVLEVHSPHLSDAAWWRSQDRAEPDGCGGFRLLGRADRIVKVEERRVSLDALERQVRAHPAVGDVRVLLLGGSRSTLAAVVAMARGLPVPEDAAARRALSQALSRHLAASQDAVTRPRRWRFVSALPANAQGKVTEAALTALFRPERPAATWTLRTPTQARVELPLDASLAVFDGHFPQAAILPGVAQLDWAVQLAREAFLIPSRFLRMEALKFQRVARPGDTIHLELEWQAERCTLQFRYTSVHGPHASGRVVFDHGE